MVFVNEMVTFVMKTVTQYIQKYVGSEGVYVKYIMIADSNSRVLSILWVTDMLRFDFVSRLDFERFPKRRVFDSEL